MDTKIKSFLENQRIAVLSITQPDGTVHSAAMHFSFQEEPFALYFQTSIKSRKVANILQGNTVAGSVVIGFSETDWLTLQLDGKVHVLLTEDEKKKALSTHYQRYTRLLHYAVAADIVLLGFIPHWWRFSNFTSYPPETISSEENKED